MNKINLKDHKILALWAVECAGHVLPVFEACNKDERPRKAIAAARAWAQGKLKMTEARQFAFAAHAAAREAKTPEAIAAARSAGHAAATAHVPGHAKHAAAYAIKAVAGQEAERDWQLQRLPTSLHAFA